jgi:DNA polymerase-3 subunit beta
VVSAKQLQGALNATIDSIALSETRVELAGLLMKCSSKSLTFAATDSFRLVEKVLPIACSRETSVILPRNTVNELIRVAGEIEGDITIHISENQIAFLSDDCELVSRLIDGHYPDYQKVIPEKFVSKALVVKHELESTARLAGLFSSSISDIKLSCQEKIIVVSAKNADRGETQVEIDALLKNDPFEIALNYHYLLDGLKIMPSDKVVIEFTGTGSPLVLRPGDEDKTLVYLIMPLRN